MRREGCGSRRTLSHLACTRHRAGLRVSHGWASVRTSDSFGRHSSERRTGCANERPSGSVRGAPGNRCPYRDPTIPIVGALSLPREVEKLAHRSLHRRMICAERRRSVATGWASHCAKSAGRKQRESGTFSRGHAPLWDQESRIKASSGSRSPVTSVTDTQVHSQYCRPVSTPPRPQIPEFVVDCLSGP